MNIFNLFYINNGLKKVSRQSKAIKYKMGYSNERRSQAKLEHFDLDKLKNGSIEDPLYRIISSERLNRDMHTLMNSSFWIESLKNNHAKGISDQLYCKLHETLKLLTSNSFN